MPDTGNRLSELLKHQEAQLLTDWITEQSVALADRSDLIKETELKVQGKEFLGLLRGAVRLGDLDDIQEPEWELTRDMLAGVSRARALQGFTPSETATFVFSLKKPLFVRLQEEFTGDPAALAEYLWITTMLLDKLGLWTTEVYQKSREEVISRQQQELLVAEIISNAVKHARNDIEVTLVVQNDQVRLEVCDDGPGFPPDFDWRIAANTGLALIDSTGRHDLKGAISYGNRLCGGASVVVNFPILSASGTGDERYNPA